MQGRDPAVNGDQPVVGTVKDSVAHAAARVFAIAPLLRPAVQAERKACGGGVS